jgi:glycosyltransferase involved in cell wall biosynthesis
VALASIQMKNVLMIAYNYPPLAGMGMLRSLKLAKYLPTFGWKPTILTVSTSVAKHISSPYWICDESEGNLPNVNIIRTKFFSLNLLSKYLTGIFSHTGSNRYVEEASVDETQKPKSILRNFLLSFCNKWLLFPDNTITWYPFAVRQSLQYIKRQRINLIFSTSLPITSHIIARSISRKTNVPWVADFRDPWSRSHYDDSGSLRKRIDTLIETGVISSADALTTVSGPLRDTLIRVHKDFQNRTFVIHNGYDPDDYSAPEIESQPYFNITFTGRMYDIDFERKGRTPQLLFQALEQLHTEGRIDLCKVKVNLYGEYPNDLYHLISEYQLQDSVRCLGPVPFRESIAAQQHASILLLLNWDDSDYEGIVTGKIFEYLGACKPILAIPFYNRSVDTILNKTKAGITIIDLESLKKQISKWYQEYIKKGSVPYRGITREIEKFSRLRAAEDMSRIFEEVHRNK